MRKYLSWWFVSVGTFPIPKEFRDPYEWVRLLTLTACRKRLEVVPDFDSGTVKITPRETNWKGYRKIVPWRFSYERSHEADAHYRTAYNQGFTVRWPNRRQYPYVITITPKNEIPTA